MDDANNGLTLSVVDLTKERSFGVIYIGDVCMYPTVCCHHIYRVSVLSFRGWRCMYPVTACCCAAMLVTAFCASPAEPSWRTAFFDSHQWIFWGPPQCSLLVEISILLRVFILRPLEIGTAVVFESFYYLCADRHAP